MSKSAFKEWWESNASPAGKMPVGVAAQVEWMAKAAFTAGQEHERALWETKREPKAARFNF